MGVEKRATLRFDQSRIYVSYIYLIVEKIYKIISKQPQILLQTYTHTYVHIHVHKHTKIISWKALVYMFSHIRHTHTHTRCIYTHTKIMFFFICFIVKNFMSSFHSFIQTKLVTHTYVRTWCSTRAQHIWWGVLVCLCTFGGRKKNYKILYNTAKE